MCAENVLSSVNKFDRLRELLSGPALTDAMTQEERVERQRHFNAVNNPAIIGATGCPYDSPEYRTMTNSVLSESDIALIIESAPDLNQLLEIAIDFAAGYGKLRDVPAARRMYEYIKGKALERGDMDLYISATRALAEDLALPMAHQDITRARALFSEIADICRAKNAATLGMDSKSYDIHYTWSLAGLAYCYEQMGDKEKAEGVYTWLVDKSGAQRTELAFVSCDFIRILNRARAMLNPSPEQLSALALELDVAAQQCRTKNNNVQSPLLTKIVLQAASFRRRADVLSLANTK